MSIGRIARWLAVPAIAAYAWLAVQVYRSQMHPETFRAWDGPSAWIVGPPARSLLTAADARIDRAIEALNDTSRPGDERIAKHRENLKIAEDLLIRSLRAEPAQPAALAKLASVRWELDPPLDERSLKRGLDLIELAARLAPDAPRVRLQLGELLLRAGRTQDALPHLRRAVETDPASAARVVAALRDRWLTAGDIRDALPPDPRVLIELKGAYLSDSDPDSYLDAVEPSLPTAPAGLIEAYGDAALVAGEPARLLEAMDRLTPAAGAPDIEAERQLERARALAATGLESEAIAATRTARRLAPGNIRTAERSGRIALDLKDGAYAQECFRDALASAARAGANANRRATLYRLIGQAEDTQGRPDRAYRAYLQALKLNPKEGIAKNRVEQLEKAAGVRK